MKAYTFRIVSQENEDFLREVKILSDQTFLDFHDFIMEICKLQGNELASFYACTDDWYKEIEISLIDMSVDDDDEYEDDDFDEEISPEQKLPLKLMGETYIANIVKRKNQKLVYEYDFFSPVVLYIECVDIEETESDEFPEMIISKGELDYLGGASVEDVMFVDGDTEFEDDFDDDELEDED